jgi:hypothetical protein
MVGGMRRTVDRWWVKVMGGGAMLAGAWVVFAGQPDTIVVPDPKPAVAASRPATRIDAATTVATSVPASAPVVVKVKRLAAPAGAELAAARKLVEEVYREDVAVAKTPGQRENLARRLWADATREKEMAGRYAMLLKAKELAMEAGDVETVERVIVELERTYEVDGVKLASEALLRVIRGVHTPGQKKALADFTQDFAARALEGENYEVARAMAEKNGTAARMVGDVGMIREAQALQLAVTDAEAACGAAKKAAETLAAKPGDGEANLKVGTYRCFYRGEWKEGLGKLAAGSDRGLAELAKEEMSAGGTPEERLKLGDAWWEVGLKGTVVTKRGIWRHAAGFYTAALPSLSGLVKAKVNKRLEEAGLAAGGLEIPAFATGYLETIAKQLPAKGEAPLEAVKKLSKVQGAGTALEVDRREVPVRFAAKLTVVQQVESRRGSQLLSVYEMRFEFNGLPVRLAARRIVPLTGRDDPVAAATMKAWKEHPEAVYVIEGSARGFGMLMSRLPENGESCLMMNVNFVPSSTFEVREKE